jgi:hypothetical protein
VPLIAEAVYGGLRPGCGRGRRVLYSRENGIEDEGQGVPTAKSPAIGLHTQALPGPYPRALAGDLDQGSDYLVLLRAGQNLKVVAIRIVKVDAAVVARPTVYRYPGGFEDAFDLLVLSALQP